MPPRACLFICDDGARVRRIQQLLRRVPALHGESIRVHQKPGLKDRHGPVHAGSFLRERRIALNCREREFPRIFLHEVFHFVWLRLGNQRRWNFEALIGEELRRGVRGELGWSAEWRKRDLSADDPIFRTRLWREYCCESFCDTAAWLFAGLRAHPEFTLSGRARERRRQWFAVHVGRERLQI